MGMIGTMEIVIILVALLILIAPSLAKRYIKAYKDAKMEIKDIDAKKEPKTAEVAQKS